MLCSEGYLKNSGCGRDGMKEQYGLKEYKALLEKAFKDYEDPMQCPFGMDPYTDGVLYRHSKREILQWCLEMLPEVE
jgi:hypothetical protein